MKKLLSIILGLLSLALPMSAAVDGKFYYSYPGEDELPYDLGYQYSVYDLKESDTEGWKVMLLEKPLTLTYHITSEEDKTVEVVFDPLYLEVEDILIPETAIDPDTGEEYTVTAIGKMAFDDCPKIRSVIMGNSITRIEDYAFNMCENKVLHNIGYIKFSENLTHIGNYAFRNCHNLTTGYYTEGDQWPLSVRNFLRNVDYPVYGYGGRLTGLDNYLLLPASVEYIGKHAFEGCHFEINHLDYGFCKIKIPNPGCVIDDYAFAGCKLLELITIGGDLNFDGLHNTSTGASPKGRIGDYAFADCNLMRVDIPASIESIGEGAFSNSFKRKNSKSQRSEDGQVYFDQLNWFYPRSLFNNEDDWWHAWNFTPATEILTDYKLRCQKLLENWHTNAVTIQSDGTNIGINAFADNPQLGTVVISGHAGEIGAGAFQNCPNLSIAELPEDLERLSNGMFRNCTSLQSMVVPPNVKEIGDSAFYLCTKLKNIELPSTLENVNPYTFYGCEWVDITTLPEGVRSIGSHAFYACETFESFTIPASVESIGDYAFAKCYTHTQKRTSTDFITYHGLMKVSLGDGVKTIGAHAFEDCQHLSQIEFGNSLETIGDYAFQNCMSCPEDHSYDTYSASEVTLPESLQSIGVGAFQGCSDLPEVYLNDAINELPDFAFAYCTQLAYVGGLDHVESSSQTTFKGCYYLENLTDLYDEEDGVSDDGIFYSEDGTEIISALPNIMEAIIPEGVTKIRDGAFADCGALGYVEFPTTLEEIGSRAFENCVSLMDAELLNIKMGEFVYAGCTGIEAVIISSDFDQDINDNWFAGCYNMQYIEVDGDNARYDSYEGVYLTDKGGTTLLRAPSGISDVEIPETCKKIGDYAFSNCINLYYVNIPSTVTHIGAHAFENCAMITDWGNMWGLYIIEFDNPAVKIGEYAFNGCSNLTSVSWGEDAEPGAKGRIGAYAFKDCENLHFSTGDLSDAVIDTLDPYAFADFPGLQEIKLPETLEMVGDHAFYNCPNLTSVVFPEGLKSIGNSAFRSTPLKLLDLPDTIEEIGDSAFMDCSNVMSLKLPANLKKINPYTFYKCFSKGQFDAMPEENFNLSVEIPDGVESIGDYAFYGCAVNSNKYHLDSKELYTDIYYFYNYGLSSLTIGENVAAIGAHAFDGCSHLIDVKMGEAVASIGEYAFKDCFKDCFKGVREGEYTLTGYTVKKLEDYTVIWQQEDSVPQPISLPEGLTSMGEGAFSGCMHLPSINFPATLTTIPTMAFNGCGNFTKIDLPEGLTTIGEAAFGGCKGVSEISIPASFREGSRVFVDCDSAFYVTYNAALPASFDEGFFSPKVYSSKKSVVKAPNALLEDIKGKTPWALFYKIEAKNDTLLHLERVLETKNGLRFRVLSNKPVPYCEVAGPAVKADGPTTYEVPQFVENIDETSDYYGMSYKVIRIGNDAFEDDLTLVGITIPESVYEIGQEAFNGCKNLPEINLPKTITNMCERAFANCYGLTYFEVPPLVTRLNPEVLKDCRGLYSIRMHDNIEELGMGALMDCRHLRAFERSENWKLRIIDDYAMKNCIELEEINIPEGVTKIGKEAMYYCQKLNTVSLPKTLELLGGNTFDDCEVLSTIKVYTETPPKTVGERNLTDQNCKIYVQAKTLDAYKEHWKVHEHRIEPGIFVNQPTRQEMPVYIPGTTYKLTSTMPLSGQTMTWSTFNKAVATQHPNHDGTIFINAVGPSHIKVETDHRFYHECDLDVYPQIADANWDGGFDISDAVNIANYAVMNHDILANWWKTGRRDFGSRDEWERFYTVGADVNDDGSISFADASATVKVVLAQTAEQSAAAVSGIRRARNDGGITDALVIFPAEGGKVRVGLDNSKEYVALQANIRVPEGMTLDEVKVGSRAAGHVLSSRRIDGRTMRVVLFDLGNSVFADEAGSILECVVSGENVAEGDVEIFDVIASDISATSHVLTSRYGSGMTDLSTVSRIGEVRFVLTADGLTIYDAAGKNIAVFTVDGKVVKSFTGASDSETVRLEAGIYIVTVNGESLKIVVK